MAALLGSDQGIDALVNKAGRELSSGRTVPLGKLLKEDASAQFYLLISPDANVEGVKFSSGSEKLKPFSNKLQSREFAVALPSSTSTKIVVSGTVSCSDRRMYFVRVKWRESSDFTGYPVVGHNPESSYKLLDNVLLVCAPWM